jgi:glucosylceramidase
MKRLALMICLLAPAGVFAQNGQKVLVYRTAAQTALRLTLTDTLAFADFGQPLETQACVFIDPLHHFQTLTGIGGALTDASAETFAKLPAKAQEEVLRAYYDSTKGIGYTLARTHIGSCDFSSGSYMYVKDGDTALSTFSVAHDEQYRIPLIKRAIAAAGGHLTMFVSPWTPPVWMKDNHDLLHGGHLLTQFYQTWANYYIKFIRAYEAEGIPIWGLTVQNEPMAKQKWESCIYSAEQERDFIKGYLGPTLQKEGMGDLKLMAWDHNRDLLYQRASTVLNDPDAAKYVWGIGFHWYVRDLFDNVARVKESFPNINLMLTEACLYPFNWAKLGDWSWGEKYGTSMIHDFNNGAVGWTDWNILLDQTGGPNHVQNFCFAPIHADTRDGSLHYMNSYYYIGHFSRFIRPGANRISVSTNRDDLLATGFINPNGQTVVVVMNTGAKKYSFKLWCKGQAATTTSLPHSIMTLVY